MYVMFIAFIFATLDSNIVYGGGIILAATITAIATVVASRLLPASQKHQLTAVATSAEVAAAEAAVHSVREALGVSQLKIDALERQINALNITIGELRGELRGVHDGRASLEERLSLILAERAALKQQVLDLEMRVANAHVDGFGKPDAIVMSDIVTGEIHFASEGVFSLLGYTPKELIGRSIDSLVPDHLREIHKHERGGYTHHPRMRPMGTGIELFARKRDGIVIPVDISLHPTSDGRVIALVKHRSPTKDGASAEERVKL